MDTQHSMGAGAARMKTPDGPPTGVELRLGDLYRRVRALDPAPSEDELVELLNEDDPKQALSRLLAGRLSRPRPGLPDELWMAVLARCSRGWWTA